MRAWIFIAVALFSAPLAWPAKPARPVRQVDITIPKAKLAAYFDALEAQGLLNGSIAISQRGMPRYQRSIGFAELGPTGPSAGDEGTRYRIGEVSALFTTVLTMQLVESASIGLDSRLAEFFPDLPNALDITYRDLLQQRSGLTNYLELPEYEQWRFAAPDRAVLLDAIGAPARPRERTETSATSYLLLGYIVEKVYEKPYVEILRRRILDKAGLSRTYPGRNTERASLEARTYVHTPQGWQPERESDPEWQTGARGLVSAPTDLVRFLDALFAGTLVTAQSLGTMRGTGDEPGAGFERLTIAGRTGYGLSGRFDSNGAWVWHQPETGVSIAFASNGSALELDAIREEVLRIVFERGHKPALDRLRPAR